MAECPEENLEEAIALVERYMMYPFGDDKELNLPFTVDSDVGDSYAEAK